MMKFLTEVRAELAKVVWPTWNETIKYTVTVILFSVGVSVILGAADLGLIKLFEKILGR